MDRPTLTILLTIALASGVAASCAKAQKIYWADPHAGKIQRADVDGSNVEDVVVGVLRWPKGMALDVAGGKMYWVDSGTDRIRRSNLDGSEVETILAWYWHRSLKAIALDLAASKLYWTDHLGVHRADLDGSDVEERLIPNSYHNNLPGIAIDSTRGKLYWTEDDYRPIVWRADLDGANAEDVVRLEEPGLAAGIALDVAGGKVYWVEPWSRRIRRANFDGSEVETSVSVDGELPERIALDAVGGKIYWTDGETRAIQRANLDGSSIETIAGPTTSVPRGIALNLTDGWVYWTESWKQPAIKRATLDGTEIEAVVTTQIASPSGLALDRTGRKIYWTDQDTRKIQRAQLDGSSLEDVLVADADLALGIVMDASARQLYWLEQEPRSTLRRASLDGTNAETLVDPEYPYLAGGLDLDHVAERVYWAIPRWNEPFWRATFDGVDVEALQADAAQPSGISIDPVGRKLYWNDIGYREVHRADLDGQNAETLAATHPRFSPMGIAVDPQHETLYWSDYDTNVEWGVIRRANLNGSEAEDLLTGLGEPAGIALDLCGPVDQLTLTDHAVFVDCMTGPGEIVSWDCWCRDLDGDVRVGMLDEPGGERLDGDPLDRPVRWHGEFRGRTADQRRGP